jgi:hypothetical protein
LLATYMMDREGLKQFAGEADPVAEVSWVSLPYVSKRLRVSQVTDGRCAQVFGQPMEFGNRIVAAPLLKDWQTVFEPLVETV